MIDHYWPHKVIGDHKSIREGKLGSFIYTVISKSTFKEALAARQVDSQIKFNKYLTSTFKNGYKARTASEEDIQVFLFGLDTKVS